ncbi:hypothetical protein DRJ48_00245 [Candidatus Woesearchaeota archaeon]|nr:hypothetical protein [Candidatus Woesearchaeota archaeon]RLE43679.1 MAG: hypothetical protein DRJ48_00245 [Candidatus Woesearchaeota archaeon]
MNKRGTLLGYDMVYWIIRLVVLVIIIAVHLMFGSMMMTTNIDTKLGETQLMISGLLYSPDGFTYTENGRAYPGIVDFERFDKSTIDRAFHSPQSDELLYWGYNLTLFSKDRTKLKSIIGNPKWHKRWVVLAGTGLPGSGSALRWVEEYYVMIKYKDRVEPGLLRIDITRPRK